MKTVRKSVLAALLVIIAAAFLSCGGRPVEAIEGLPRAEGDSDQPMLEGGADMLQKVTKSEQAWREVLTEEQFRILRRKGTERAFSSPLHALKDEGVYRCAACDLDLFGSDAKFDSGTGWPSFYRAIESAHVTEKADNSLFTRRTEVLCARCDGHLGHVFKDGPPPTGLRYCINGLTLKFVPEKEAGGG